MPEQDDQQLLLQRIRERRRVLEDYLGKARPRSARLNLLVIVSSALAAALTAAPAVGGTRFTDWAAPTLGLDGAPAVWQPLCIAATVVSLVAAVSANLSKSRNAESRIISAETCSYELESLETMLEFRTIPLSEALTMYQQSLAKVAFLPGPSATPRMAAA